MAAVLEELHYLPPCFEGIEKPAPFKIFRGGRGGARSWTVSRALLLLGLNKPIRVLCARETQKSIRESVHKLLVDQIARLGLMNDYRVQHVAITGNREWPGVAGKPGRTEFIFAGIADQTVAAIKSFEDIDICWVEEAQTVSDHSWTTLLPTLFRSKPGCEVWVTFNPELDSDPVWERFVKNPPPGTLQFISNWRDNPWFPAELNKLREHDEKILPRYEYEWIWEGKCKPAVAGAIYSDEMAALYEQRRVTIVPYDPYHLVYPVFDLGWNDQMTIGFWQRHIGSLRCIDYLEDDHKTYDWYSARMRERPYSFGDVFLPHDGGHASPESGRTPQKILEGLGWSVRVLPRQDKEQGIKDTRMAMKQMAFDAEKCAPLLEHMKRYRRVIPSTTNEPAGPLHDIHSHGADMVRYAAQAAPQMDDNEGMKLPKLDYESTKLLV